MLLIAFRSEYQLTVDPAKNRIFYQNFGQMQGATELPHYRADWSAALAQVQPGFSILSDMQVVNQASPALRAEFVAVEQLIVARGVRIVAEIHIPGLPTRHLSDAVTTSQAMPVRQFLNLWDAAQFLDEG
ncbi:hypothetical protein GCM10022409_48270 [Hymenobacter glaciei]|uniref:Uncharacterized protein n=1 Tax=Hymenobacter glaciei TaxID=877209 RepID=A0ABP7UY54_9BACT